MADRSVWQCLLTGRHVLLALLPVGLCSAEPDVAS